MLSELKKSLQSTLYERITSPLSGAFCISWIICNWRLLYYIITADDNIPIYNRIEYIEHNYLRYDSNLIYPALCALFFVLLYPFCNSGALFVWLNHKKLQRKIKDYIEKTQLLSIAESIELRSLLDSQDKKFKELMESKNTQINTKDTQIGSLQKELNQNIELINEVQSRLNAVEKEKKKLEQENITLKTQRDNAVHDIKNLRNQTNKNEADYNNFIIDKQNYETVISDLRNQLSRALDEKMKYENELSKNNKESIINNEEGARFNKLLNNMVIQKYDKYIDPLFESIFKGESFLNSQIPYPILKLFIENGFIQIVSDLRQTYKSTDQGSKFYNYYNWNKHSILNRNTN